MHHTTDINRIPSYHVARRNLDVERHSYDRSTVNTMSCDGWGVYAIWGGPYECLYVGKSAQGESVKNRLLYHLSRHEPNDCLRRTLYLLRSQTEFAVCLTDSAAWASQLERQLIRHFQPECNRNLLS